MHPDKKLIRQIFLYVLGAIAFAWVLLQMDKAMQIWRFLVGMLSPFAVGAGLAFVMNVLMRPIENRLRFIKKDKLRRVIAVVLTLLAVLLVIAVVVMLLIPQITSTVKDIAAQLPGFFESTENTIRQFLADRPDLLAAFNKYVNDLNWESIIQKATSIVGGSISSIFTGAISVVGSVVGAIYNAIISFVFAIYCLMGKETLARQGKKLLYSLVAEKYADETVRILRLTNTAFSNFMTGQVLEAIILALLFAVTMACFRMPYIPLICVLIGVTALVPLVGAFAGCILGAFFILVKDPLQAVTFVIMFLVLQQFEGNVIYPRVVGSSIGLPSMWVLLSVTVGGELLGVAGMLIMVPIASVIYILLKEFTAKRLALRNIQADKLVSQPPDPNDHFLKRWTNKKKKKEKK